MKDWKKNLDVLFDENNPKLILLCQEQNPKLFQYLKNIYTHYQDGNTNPFQNYCYEKEALENQKNFDYRKHGIFTPSKRNKGILVKKLRFMQSTVNPWLLEKKNIKKKDKTLIGYNSVSIYCTRLYWDKDLQKIIFIPVYCPAVNLKTKQINEQHPIYKQYTDLYLKNRNVEFIVDLFNGNYVEIEKSNGKIIKRHIETYHKRNKRVSCKPDNYLSPKDKFTLYDVDVLGNKKKRLTWPK